MFIKYADLKPGDFFVTKSMMYIVVSMCLGHIATRRVMTCLVVPKRKRGLNDDELLQTLLFDVTAETGMFIDEYATT